MGNYLDVDRQHARPRPNENYAPRDPAAVLARHLQAESGWHAAARSDRPADSGLHPGRPSTTSRACSPAGSGPPRRRRASRITSIRWSPNEAQHDIGAKTLLNGVVLPAKQTTAQGPERRDRQHLQRPERRPVHLEAADSAPGDEQSDARRTSRGSPPSSTATRRHPAATCRPSCKAILLDPGGSRRRSRPTRTTASCVIRRSSSSTCCARFTPGRPTAPATATGTSIPRPSTWGWTCSDRRRSSATSRPARACRRRPVCAARSSACSRPSTALRRANFVNTMVFARITVSTNAPNGTSLDFSALQALAGEPRPARGRAQPAAAARHDVDRDAEQRSSGGDRGAATNPFKRARTALYLVASSSQYQVEK